MKKISLFASGVLAILSANLLTGTGCANIIPPSGGPRDSLPPRMVEATPDDSALNFRGNRIVLTFDEYVDLQNVQQNLLFTPTFETNPVIEARLRTLTIRLRDSLEANTTYTFDFGNAIKDVNESNVLPNFKYTFSTGPALDSLQLSGKVVLAENGRIDSTLVVILHRNLTDSAVVNQRPRYVARLDRNGNFTFTNLPPGAFAIYALGDAGIARRYLGKTQLFAFADSPVQVGSNPSPVTLYAFREAAPRAVSAPVAPSSTANRAIGTTDRRLQYTTNLAGNQQDLLTDFHLNFDRPLRLFDSARIQLTDSNFRSAPYTASLDSLRKRLTVKTAWMEGHRYHFILDKDFGEDSTGRRLFKTDTVTFTTREGTDYGRVSIRVRNADAALSPVLQFLQNGTVQFSIPVRGGSITIPRLLPAEYELNVLYDRNGNGVWDPGQFFGARRQPERVVPVERRITVKAAWDNDFEITL